MVPIVRAALIGAVSLVSIAASAQSAVPPSAGAASPLRRRPSSVPPGPDARVKITDDYAALVARDAYFWAWPMVNLYNRRLAFAQVTEDRAVGPCCQRAAQPAGHAHRLCRSGRAAGRLSQPGRGLRPGRAGARCLAGGDPGAGLRRPLLGLPGGRPAHRQLRAARQDVRHQARLLPAGRAQLEGRDAQGHHQGVPRLDQHRLGCAAHLPGRHAGRQARRPGAAAPGRDVSAGGIRRHDEEHRLEQDSAGPARRNRRRRSEVGVPGEVRRPARRGAGRRAAAAGRGSALRPDPRACSRRPRPIPAPRRR